ncbi:hypothetical protein H6G93_30800 [Nostoc sp. FACHB-973]|nr:hypothetical protein [Nostoc sp. FACHB-973]
MSAQTVTNSTCLIGLERIGRLDLLPVRESRVAQLCYPKNVQIIWDNLFSGNP